MHPRTAYLGSTTNNAAPLPLFFFLSPHSSLSTRHYDHSQQYPPTQAQPPEAGESQEAGLEEEPNIIQVCHLNKHPARSTNLEEEGTAERKAAKAYHRVSSYQGWRRQRGRHEG